MKKTFHCFLLLFVNVLGVVAAEPEVQQMKFEQHNCKSPPIDLATMEQLSATRKIVKPRTGPTSKVFSPKAPRGTLKAGERAIVVLDILVTELGTISEVRVAEPSGSPAWDRAAMEVLEKWKVDAGSVDGEPKCMWMKYSMMQLP